MSATSTASDSSANPAAEGAASHSPVFATTHWSVVLMAGRKDTKRAQAALEQLCQSYWYPLYAYVRRRGFSAADAQDLTQEFFTRLLKRNAVASASPDKGRFRSFLLTAIKHFLADEWDKAQAQKRGAGQAMLIDPAEAERRLTEHPLEDASPEKVYERRWAIALLERVHQRLEEEHRTSGREKLFAKLRFALAGARSAVPYAELAKQLEMTEGAIKVAVHRLRQRYRELLQEEIAQTVTGPEEAEAELRCLLKALTD